MASTDSFDGEPSLRIGIPGFSFHDLFDPRRLSELTDLFHDSIRRSDAPLWERFDRYRTTFGEGMKPEEISEVLVDAAPHLSRFVAQLFQVEEEHGRRRSAVGYEMVIFAFKRDFVMRRALKRHPSIASIDIAVTRAEFAAVRDLLFADFYASNDIEHATASAVMQLVELERALKAPVPVPEVITRSLEDLLGRLANARERSVELAALVPPVDSDEARVAAIVALLGLFERWVALEHHMAPHGQHPWPSLRTPHAIDYTALVTLHVPNGMPPGTRMGPPEQYRQRDGFALTDRRMDHREVMNEVEYCIYCHQRDKDSCSKGLHEKDGSRRRNPLGVALNGCPLGEKISEMHLLKHNGDGLGALALVMIDNPMCPGTGHRICNDCMKGCIYQKQDPVNIPQIETSVLTEVLDYPFGFEIYSFLTRWNPLNVRRPHALPYNGKKVLVVGLGPAGYTLAHHLLNEGFGVVGIDGLKIEPLPEKLVGTKDRLPDPIADWREFYDELDQRVLLGFGGVSEYGITVRWDKNFLKVIYITLARRRTFKIHGGVRFGGTITIDDARRMGFDHIAIATGAGKPTIVPMRNNLIRGVRQASDFLMALQLTGAYKPGTLANLQLRLPAVVIGGGLTGIDTATEAMAYYPVQVERVLERYEVLSAELGEDAFWKTFGEEDHAIIHEFLGHARQLRTERERAASEGRQPDIIGLLRSWGGVSLVYRKSMGDSPAYRLNHEEIIKALEEGIYFIEDLSPVEIVPDHNGAVGGIVFERQEIDEQGKWRGTGEMVPFPAHSVMVAAGTSPNTIIERENPGAFAYDNWKQFFAPYVEERAADVVAN